MTEKQASIATWIIAGLILCVISFFWGRSTINEEPKVEYVKGETVAGSVSQTQLEPVKEEKPKIKYRDRYLPVDTSAIIADYELKRSYSLIAFDNKTQGKLQLYPVVQYNKLIGVDYDFAPIIKKETFYKERTLEPFGSISYSTLGSVGLGGGLFYHNLGFEYQYQLGFNDIGNGHSFGLKYKF